MLLHVVNWQPVSFIMWIILWNAFIVNQLYLRERTHCVPFVENLDTIFVFHTFIFFLPSSSHINNKRTRKMVLFHLSLFGSCSILRIELYACALVACRIWLSLLSWPSACWPFSSSSAMWTGHLDRWWSQSLPLSFNLYNVAFSVVWKAYILGFFFLVEEGESCLFYKSLD